MMAKTRFRGFPLILRSGGWLVAGFLGAIAANGVAAQSDEKGLDAALAPEARQAPNVPFEVRGEAELQWRTATQRSPIGKGTFQLRGDGQGGIRLHIDLGRLGRAEYGVAGAQAWEVDPVIGATVWKGQKGASVRRLLAVLSGNGRWRGLYSDAHPVAPTTKGVAKQYRFDSLRDAWSLDGAGRVIAAVVEHHRGARNGMTIGVALSDFKIVDGHAFAQRVAIDREHHRYALTVRSVKRGEKASAEPIAPSKAVVSRAARGRGKEGMKTIELTRMHTASIRKTVAMAEISKELATMLPEIMFALRKQGIEPLGAPFTRYHSMSGQSADVEVGFPVARAIEPTGRIKAGELPAGTAATAWHVGPYHELGRTHGALQGWIAKEGMTSRGGPWEVYWTDPGLEPDKSKWRTQIFVPVATK